MRVVLSLITTYFAVIWVVASNDNTFVGTLRGNLAGGVALVDTVQAT